MMLAGFEKYIWEIEKISFYNFQPLSEHGSANSNQKEERKKKTCKCMDQPRKKNTHKEANVTFC